jgi:hypothetical protein
MLQLRRSLRNIRSFRVSSTYSRRTSLRYSSVLYNIDSNTNVDFVTTKGVSLSFLDRFVNDCGRSYLFELTTQEVYEKFIAPKAISMSYCEAALQKKTVSSIDDTIHEANVYISHCWDSKFLDTIGCIQSHFKAVGLVEDPVLWIDIFSANISQRQKSQGYLKDLEKVFQSSQFHSFLFLITPWNNLFPFSRSSFLYDFYLLNQRFKKEEASKLTSLIISSSSDDLLRLLTTKELLFSITSLKSIEDSSAPSHSLEKESILSALTTTNDIEQVNMEITHSIQKVLLSTVEKHYEQAKLLKSKDEISWLIGLSYLHPQKALEFLEEAYTLSMKRVPQYPQTLQIMLQLGIIFNQLNRFSDAENIFRQYLTLFPLIYKKDALIYKKDANSVNIRNDKFPILAEEKELVDLITVYDQLARLYQKDVFSGSSSLPSSSSSSSSSQSLSKYRYYSRLAFEETENLYNEYHPSTIKALLGYATSFGSTIQEEGDKRKYEELLEKSLKRQEKAFQIYSKPEGTDITNTEEQKLRQYQALTIQADMLQTKQQLSTIYYQTNRKNESKCLLQEIINVLKEEYEHITKTLASTVSSVTTKKKLKLEKEYIREQLMNNLYDLCFILIEENDKSIQTMSLMEQYLALVDNYEVSSSDSTSIISSTVTINEALTKKVNLVFQLGTMYGQQGLLEKLEKLFITYEKQFLILYGDSSPSYYFVSSTLVQLLMKKKQFLKAEFYAKHCYSLQKSLLTKNEGKEANKPIVLKHLQELIVIYRQIEIDPSLSKEKKEEEMNQKLNNLDFYLKELYSYHQEEKQYKESYELGHELITMAWSRKQYSLIEERFEECRQLLEKWEKEHEQVLQLSSSTPLIRENPTMKAVTTYIRSEKVKLMSGKAMYYSERGNFIEADTIFHHCLLETQKYFDLNSLNTIIVMNQVSLSNYQRRNYDDAIKIMEINLEKMLTLYPEETNHALPIIAGLVNYYHASKKHNDRDRILSLCYNSYLLKLGKDHTMTKQIENMISSFHKK